MKAKDLPNKRLDGSLSASIVSSLQREGMTIKEIGDLMGGLSHSFLSLVKSGNRSLTVSRLKMLEKALKRPLPLLLLQAMEENSVPKELKPQYRLLQQILKQAAKERKLSWKL